MKIWTVTCNDGGWHQSTPSYQEVAETKEEAIRKEKYWKTAAGRRYLQKKLKLVS